MARHYHVVRLGPRARRTLDDSYSYPRRSRAEWSVRVRGACGRHGDHVSYINSFDIDRSVNQSTASVTISRTPCTLDVLHLEGAFRAPLTRELAHEVQTLLCHGTRTIVLDFTGVPSIDAAGIGQLVRYTTSRQPRTACCGSCMSVHACANSSTGLRFSSSWTCRTLRRFDAHRV